MLRFACPRCGVPWKNDHKCEGKRESMMLMPCPIIGCLSKASKILRRRNNRASR